MSTLACRQSFLCAIAVHWRRLCGSLLLMAAAVCAAVPAVPTVPGFAELEAQGAVIGNIVINPQNIFDLTNEAENTAFFRWANRLHIPTREEVIRRVLLFKSGERLSRQKIDETERLLRNSAARYEVLIRPLTWRDGVVDVEVTTQDTWTLNITGSYSRAGGDNKTSFGIAEENLFGTGMRIGYQRVSDLDRKGSEFELAMAQAFDGWTAIEFARGRFNDGSRTTLTVDRPFYSLDTRQAARLAWRDEDRLDSIANAGQTVGEYRHRMRAAEISGGWSSGLVDGWTRRMNAGVVVGDHAYAMEAGRVPPPALPVDYQLRAVFLRVDWLEDRFLKVKNFNRIERTEYLAVGMNARLQMTIPIKAMGAGQTDGLFNASVAQGWDFGRRRIAQLRANLERRIGGDAQPLLQFGGQAKFYWPQSDRVLVYAVAGWDHISGGTVSDQLEIGGTTGLRGYPSRYQSGRQRMLMSVEKRAFTTWYPWRLLRIGGAVFVDAGRAWGGANQNTVNGGWLADAGLGLRIALDRTAFANMLHLDMAAPLKRAPGIKPVQFVVKSEFSF